MTDSTGVLQHSRYVIPNREHGYCTDDNARALVVTSLHHSLYKDETWLHEARRCLNWFLGYNDLHVPLYDFKTGGCSDGLQPHGTNANEGAESTLSWLISVLTMFDIMGQQVILKKKAESR